MSKVNIKLKGFTELNGLKCDTTNYHIGQVDINLIATMWFNECTFKQALKYMKMTKEEFDEKSKIPSSTFTI